MKEQKKNEQSKIDLNNVFGDIIISQPIYDPRTKALILPAGTMIDKEKKYKLINRGITEIVIGDTKTTTEKQDEKNNEILNERLREKTIETLTKAQEEILHGGSGNMINVLENAKELTNHVLKNNSSGNDLTSYIYKKDVISHAERVSRYALNLARIYNNSRIKEAKAKLQSNMRVEKINEVVRNLQRELIDLDALSVAALFHDIGINCKEKRADLEKLKDKKATLKHLKSVYPSINDNIFNEYRDDFSSVYSYCLISDIVFPGEKKRKGFSSDVKRMIFYSNEGETSDKSPINVPNELLKQRIGYMYGAKVLHICDLYDKALTRAIDSKTPFEEIVASFGYYGKNGYVNNELEEDFMNNFPFYPEYTLVRLSNGQNAVVVGERTGHNFSCRPIVRLQGTNQLIDLAKKENNNITILYIIPNLKYYDNKEIFQNLVNDQIKALQNGSYYKSNTSKDKQMRKELYHKRGLRT